MFTWICPKCGAEVPPAHSECPRCLAAAAAAAAPAAAETPAPVEAPPPIEAPPPAVAESATPEKALAPPPPVFAARTYSQVEPAAPTPVRSFRRGIPPIVVALLSGAGILALLAILYMYVLPNFGESRSAPEASTASTELESVGAPGAGGSGHPLAKYLEVAGIRIQGEKDGRARIQMLVVNHSNAELPAMTMQTELLAADRGLFEFDVNLPSMGPYESREVNTVLKTGLKPYEFPDWQQVRPRFRLTEAQ